MRSIKDIMNLSQFFDKSEQFNEKPKKYEQNVTHTIIIIEIKVCKNKISTNTS